MDDLRAGSESESDVRETYVAPQLVEIGSLLELTATGHYSVIAGGLNVISSVTGG
jgi:hypothetical protein